MTDWNFYKGKKVLVTGHTGFKGSWMCQMLTMLGAEVSGYALAAPTEPSAYELCRIGTDIDSTEGDIRDLEKLKATFERVRPELVVHMAAQPLVRESYKNPVDTYSTNVMGTVNVLECVRGCDSVVSFLNVTTDKVYRNREWEWGYRENEELCGFDPYSNSKSCSELVTESYRNSFFGADSDRVLPITTMRAGNVIGGGDFAADRIVPDCARAAMAGHAIEVRNPNSVRPYQHVLEPVAAYLMVMEEQYHHPALAGNYNVGPNEDDCLTTGALADIFCREWKRQTGKAIAWESRQQQGPHEANFLKLDCSRLKRTFDWAPRWQAQEAVEKTVQWYAAYANQADVRTCMQEQIAAYLAVE